MKRTLSIFTIIIASLVLLVSCREDKPTYETPHRSVLFYMVANNNLDSYAKTNINDLVKSYSESDLNQGNLIVYYHGREGAPQLLKLSNNQKMEVIKEYANQNSADYNIMASVIADFKALCPAESYGCIFWSHASAWLPKTFFGTATKKSSKFLSLPDTQNDDNITTHPLYQYIRQVEEFPTTKAFGQNGTNWMEIEELEDGLKDNEFDFIIFDACYMGSIEVAYSLRTKAKWLLASPTEVLGEGMQYKTFAKNMFVKSTDYPAILKTVAVDYSKKYSETTTVIYDLSKVEKFTTDYKSLMATIPDLTGNSTPNNVQRYDRYSNHVLFDIVDYVSTITNGTEKAKIQSMIDELVVYKQSTPSFLGIALREYSGVSTYIPFEYYTAVTPFYKELRWWNNVLKQ